jgi:hypothetical protein
MRLRFLQRRSSALRCWTYEEIGVRVHLIFIDPCTPALVKEAPADCKDVAKDAAGVDRAAILRRVEAEVANFLRNNL